MSKLSIITINLNNKAGLEKTIKSVDRQSFSDFEYIVIDGGSTDGSVDIIKNHSSKLNYWISEPDSGVYHAMNKGIVKANGAYLLFLNSGDYLSKNNVLQKVFSENHTSDIIACGHNILKNEHIVCTVNAVPKITFGYLYFNGLNHQSTFINRALFHRIGGYDESFKYNGDIEFWYRSIILNSASTKSLPVVITNYNLNGISTLNNEQPEFRAEHKRILNHPVLKKIIPDYEQWKLEKKENKVLYWAKSKRIIFSLLKLSFNISKRLSNLNKRSSN